MTAWFGDTQGLGPKRLTRQTMIPFLTHEFEAIRWVGYNGIHGVRLHPAHGFKAIAADNHFFSLTFGSVILFSFRGGGGLGAFRIDIE
jgi:hypothetical protein